MIARWVAGWERFFFEPATTSTLALVRIAFGLLTFAWGLALAPDLFTFFSDDGLLPPEVLDQEWNLLAWFQGDTALVAVYGALLLSALCVALGLFSRLAALVLFVTLLSFERRNPLIYNSGDFVIQHLAFFLALAPSGAALSLDRWRRTRAGFWEFPPRAQWAIRLMQIQLSVIYLTSVWAKVRGETWNDGTAVSYALRLEDLERFPLPHFVVDTPLIANVLTYGALAIELGVAILIWNRRARPYAVVAGVALHLGIDYALEVGFFSYAMLILYLAFLPPETARAWVLAVRRRVRRSPVEPPAERAGVGPPSGY